MLGRIGLIDRGLLEDVGKYVFFLNFCCENLRFFIKFPDIMLTFSKFYHNLCFIFVSKKYLDECVCVCSVGFILTLIFANDVVVADVANHSLDATISQLFYSLCSICWPLIFHYACRKHHCNNNQEHVV